MSSWLPLSPGERSVAIEVLVHGPLSRTELARRLDLSQGSLTRLTKPLIESGLLVEVPETATPPEARQGRPSQPLDVVAGSRSFLGFKITADTVYGVVTTLRSDVVARLDRPLADRDPARVADLLAEMTAELADGRPAAAGIGIGVGGLVQERAVVGESPFLQWRNVPLAELVQERTGLPVVVENDVAALVEAETWFGGQAGALCRGEPRLRPALDHQPPRPPHPGRWARQRRVAAHHPEHPLPDPRRPRPGRHLRGDPRRRRRG